MQIFTNEEIKEMVGTEFKYYLGSMERFLTAIIAAYDPNIGFTVLATELVDSGGEDHSRNTDEDGNLCLVGFDAWDMENDADAIELLSDVLSQIKTNGYFLNKPSGSWGNPSCAFN